MKKFSIFTIVLWGLSALFLIVSFSFIGEGKIGESITGVVIAATLSLIAIKKFSIITIVLWGLSALFLLSLFSCIVERKIGESIICVVIATVLGFVGWNKRKNIVKKTSSTPDTATVVSPIPKVTITTASHYDNNISEDEEEINDIVTISSKSLSTMKALREFRNYVVIDFETTGFSAKTDKAIEVACLKVVDGESYEYQTLIDPKIHISSRITKINGITDADVVGFPTIEKVAKHLYDFCGNLPFVAHNASFDMGFLKQAYIEAGIKTELIYIDTLKLARSAFPEYSTHKLEFLIKELDLAEKQTHRAMDDVRCVKKLLDICISKIIEQKENAKRERAAAKLQN